MFNDTTPHVTMYNVIMKTNLHPFLPVRELISTIITLVNYLFNSLTYSSDNIFRFNLSRYKDDGAYSLHFFVCWRHNMLRPFFSVHIPYTFNTM